VRARIRFFVVLVVALAGLSAAGWLLVTQTTSGWFERDLALRADLAVSGARRALLEDLRAGDVKGLRALLADVTRDERILAGAVCSLDFKTLATTAQYPARLGCTDVGPRAQVAAQGGWAPWRSPG